MFPLNRDRAASRVVFIAWAVVIAAVPAPTLRAESTAFGVRELMEVDGLNGGHMKWRVSAAQLQDASFWDTAKEPRLSPARAVKIAREYLRTQGPAEIPPVYSVDLRMPMRAKPAERFYFYFIHFSDSSVDGSKDAFVIVLLDGSIVPPMIREREHREMPN